MGGVEGRGEMARGGLAVDDNLRCVTLDAPNFTGCTSYCSVGLLFRCSHNWYTEILFRSNSSTLI